MKSHALVLFTVLSSLAFLGGCESSQHIRGMVIEGDRSFIGAVDEQDPRLKGPGLPGAEITARSDTEQLGGMMLGTTTSNAKGEFALPFKEQRASLYPVRFGASKEGYVDAGQTMSIPASDRRVLVILKPR